MAQWVAILRHGGQLTINLTYLSSVVLADDLSPQEYDIYLVVPKYFSLSTRRLQRNIPQINLK